MSEKRYWFDRFLYVDHLEAWVERLKARHIAARIEREKAWDEAEIEYQQSEMARKRHLRAMPSGDDDPDEAA